MMLFLRIYTRHCSCQLKSGFSSALLLEKDPTRPIPRQTFGRLCPFSTNLSKRLASTKTPGISSKASRSIPPTTTLRKPTSNLPTEAYRSRAQVKEEWVKKLGQSAGETELYRAPGLKMYHFSMCTLVVVLWTCAAQMARMIPTINQNPDLNLHPAVVVAYGGICVVFVGSAIVAFWRGSGVIRYIKTLPLKTGMDLEVGIARPMLKPRVLRVNPANVFVNPALVEGKRPTWSVADNRYASWKQMQAQSRSTIRPALWWLWYSFKRVLTQDGFSTVYIKDSWGSCKLDINGTFADEGRTLYRLVSTPTESNPALTSKRFA